jgi:hypothetical protein
MKLFNKPSWIYTEINEPVYWLHLGILAFVVLGILQFWKGGSMLTLYNVLVSIPLLAIADTIAHSILKFS